MASITVHGFDEQGREHEVKLQTDGEEFRALAGRAHTMFQELVPHDVISAKEPDIESDLAEEPIIDSDGRRRAHELAERLVSEVAWDEIEKHAKIADHHPDASCLMNDICTYLINL